MAFIPTPNTVRVCMKMLQNGQQTCNIHHVDVGTEPTLSDLNTIAAVFKNWWDVSMQTLVHSGTSLQAIEVVDVSSASDDGIVYTTGLPLVGSATGNPLANNVSLSVKKATGMTGRSRRGRTYVGGMSDAHLSADRQSITPTYQAALQTAFGALLNGIAAAGYSWVVNSLAFGGSPRTEGLNTLITDIVVETILDSQRRRLPGRGL